MVDKILIAERDGDDPLYYQPFEVILDQVRITPVDEAGSETPGQTDRLSRKRDLTARPYFIEKRRPEQL